SVLLRIIEAAALFKMAAYPRELAEVKQNYSDRPVGLQDERRILQPLSQGKSLLGQFVGGLKLGPHKIESPESEEYPEQMCTPLSVRNELARPRIRPHH